MRYGRFLSFVLILLVTVASAGCAGSDPPGVPSEEPPTPSTPTPESRPTTSTPTAPTLGVVPPEAEDVVGLARENLAEKLDMAPGAVELVPVEAVEWPDASLSCPEPGQMYAQVVRRGFRIVLEAYGERHVYHADTGRSIAFCEGETSAKEPDASVQDGWPNQPIQRGQVGRTRTELVTPKHERQRIADDCRYYSQGE